MSDDLEKMMPARTPSPERPLMGMTVLAVEDSRFASEALRLLCLRSGARIRRADCLASAHRHLAIYRPTVAIVDVGLPDGSGADLIAELNNATPRVPVLLATSGDLSCEGAAMAAGADAFLAKPITSLAAFQQAILDLLPRVDAMVQPRKLPSEIVEPDLIALRDDLNHAAAVMAKPMDGRKIRYLSQFLSSVAQSAHDAALATAASDLSRLHGSREDRLQKALGRLSNIVETRLADSGPI